MSAIPQYQLTDVSTSKVQDAIIPALTKLSINPMNSGTLLKKVSLSIGSNSVAHGLGKVLQGWSVVRIRGFATIYDDQENNKTPEKSLLLISNNPVVIDLEVF